MESSIENLLANFTSKNEVSKTQEWSIRDFNNVETADRKIIVNKKYEFWVHDDALSYYSDYFADLFGRTYLPDNSKLDINVSSMPNDEEGYKRSDITIPHEELFLDILLWIYTKDGRKLTKAAKTFTSLLYLISLGIYLKLKPEFFEILLSKSNFNWKLEYFSESIWSRSIFTFSILERIVDEMKTKNSIKIIALLSWLKDCELGENKHNHTMSISNLKSKDYSFLSTYNVSNEDVLTSADLFLVRNYITRNNLMSDLTQKEVNELFSMFPALHSAFDTEKLIKEFIYTSHKHLLCIICKKTFESPQQVIESLECTNDAYHPRNMVKSDKNNCHHEGCLKKLTKGELNCCHKAFNSPGCIQGEGKHMIVIED